MTDKRKINSNKLNLIMNLDGKCLSREVTKFTLAGRIIICRQHFTFSQLVTFQPTVNLRVKRFTKIKIYYIIILLHENVKCSQDNQTHLTEGNSLNLKWVTALYFIEGSL